MQPAFPSIPEAKETPAKTKTAVAGATAVQKHILLLKSGGGGNDRGFAICRLAGNSEKEIELRTRLDEVVD